MKLVQALEILNGTPDPKLPARRVYLASGSTPLHLETFLRAHLFTASAARVEVECGLYGDLIGNLERLDPAGFTYAVVVLEWANLEPRLGTRTLGGWKADSLPDLVESAGRQLRRLQAAICRIATRIPVAISLPTLPLVPFSHYPPTELGRYELELQRKLLDFAVALSEFELIKTLNPSSLYHDIRPNEIFDFRSELNTGFPYTIQFSDLLGSALAALLSAPAPKKGLITDLDGTLWHGIVGEVGPEGVQWTLDQHAQEFGLYQQMLASLSSAGVLVGAASKNDPAVVNQAFDRRDLVLPKDSVYPIEANWGPKSESIRKILSTWNIGPEAVVFVDDSPMEIAEVQRIFPEMTCILFRAGERQGVWNLLSQLRSLFGKSRISSEDSIRLQSIRSSDALKDIPSDGQLAEDFLKSVESHIEFQVGSRQQARALELINKTNQFNLNGVRIHQAEWVSFLHQPKSFLVTVDYRDRFGPLGIIAVLKGSREHRTLRIDSWVMSCRAFSRRIEFQCLRFLFKLAAGVPLELPFQATERNKPLRDFLIQFAGEPLTSPVLIGEEAFEANCPKLYHQVEEIHELEREQANG